MKYRVSYRALEDVEAIGDFIAIDNPSAAARFIGKFEDRWAQLAQYPYSGQARDDLLPGLRHLVVGEYLTFYRVEDSEVLVLRVLHGRRRIAVDDLTG